MNFFTSDQHYGHANILKYQPNRGWANVEEMNEGLITNHNRVVGVGDTVYMLGDFGFLPQDQILWILTRLNGNKILLTGNHDKGFNATFCHNLLASGALKEVHRPGYLEVKINGNFYVMNHYAQRVWNRSHYGTFHLYGHSHGSLPSLGKSVDVGVDSKDMAAFTGDVLRPWREAEIIAYMATRTTSFEDYHNRSTP